MIKIALDIDGTITENSHFFRLLCMCKKFEVHILTGRPKCEKNKTIQLLNSLEISYNKLSFVTPKEQDKDSKVKYCIKNKINIIIDDDDHYTANIPQHIFVLKPRSNINFDFDEKKWKEVPCYE